MHEVFTLNILYVLGTTCLCKELLFSVQPNKFMLTPPVSLARNFKSHSRE